MSTNATITIKRIDGTTTSINCHYDGYIEGVGVILQLAYNTADKIEKLLELGDLSCIGYYTGNDEIQPNICIAYHRDRGEDFHQSGGRNEFNYTFDEREAVWYVEKEEYVYGTKAMNLIDVDTFPRYRKELLLDAIIESNVEGMWTDEAFAAAGLATTADVIEKCKEKALEARENR